jgi:hypothetical protein
MATAGLVYLTEVGDNEEITTVNSDEHPNGSNASCQHGNTIDIVNMMAEGTS